jgi:hypothetical protein
MSGGQACTCPAPSRGQKHAFVRQAWRVLNRNCNFSAFNGYRETPSAYSSIRCLECGAVWRSKADYVMTLPDATETERLQAPKRWRS